tara:strand:+ start:1556 stop:1978 length:423 start_codon:yes stop_codon:yes gene_type:complete
MNKLAYKSQILLDLIPASIASAAANVTDTPANLKLAGSDVWLLSNLRPKIFADIVLDASDTIDVTVRLRKTDRDGVTTTVATVVVSITATTRGQNEINFDASGITFDDVIFFQTETTSLGTANYQSFLTIDLDCPFQVST